MNGRLRVPVLAGAIAAAAVVLYGGRPSRVYSNDDLQYTLIVTRTLDGGRLYHPAGGWPFVPASDPAPPPAPFSPNARYILEWPTSIAAVHLWRAFGWRQDVIGPILSVRALAGAMGLAFFFLTLYTLTGTTWPALIGAAGLGTTASYWIYSTHVDQSIVMTMWIAASLLIFAGQHDGPVSKTRAAGMIAALVLASYFNLTASIVAFVLIAGLSVREPDKRTRAVRFIGRAAAYGLAVGIGIAAMLLLNSHSLVEGGYWRDAVFAGKPEYGVEPIRDLARAVLGVAKSQILYPGVTGSLQAFWDGLEGAAKIWFGADHAAIAALMFGSLALLTVARRTMPESRRRVADVLLGWFAAFFVFNWLWDPGYNKYWLLPLVAWWASAMLLTAHVMERHPSRGRLLRNAFAMFAIASCANDLFTQFLPEGRASQNPWVPIARTIGAASSADALFASPAYHPLDFSLAFFGRRDVLTLGLINRNTGGNRRVIAAIVSGRERSHRAVGGPVYVYGMEHLTDQQRADFLSVLGGGELRSAWTFPEVTISELVR